MLSTKDKLLMAFRKAVNETDNVVDIFVFNYTQCYVYITNGYNKKMELNREDSKCTIKFESVEESITFNEFKESYELAEQKHGKLSLRDKDKKYKENIEFLDKYVTPETK